MNVMRLRNYLSLFDRLLVFGLCVSRYYFNINNVKSEKHTKVFLKFAAEKYKIPTAYRRRNFKTKYHCENTIFDCGSMLLHR